MSWAPESTSRTRVLAVAMTAFALLATSCSSSGEGDGTGTPVAAPVPVIVVSHSVLGAVTAEIAGTAADVIVVVPNGIDPHVYEPSAKDIEAMNRADLVVVNGLGLEARLEDTITALRAKRIPVFEATDYIDTHEAPDDGGPHDGHVHSEDDPHFWTDPRLMAEVVEELGKSMEDLGLDIGDRALMLSERLLTLDQKMMKRVEMLAVDSRVLVTGHESLGYFAERYGFEIVGTIIPGLSTGAEASAGNLADLKSTIERTGVDVIFTELGTPSASAKILSDELGVEVVEISTHFIPQDTLASGLTGQTYMTFIETLVETIVAALER